MLHVMKRRPDVVDRLYIGGRLSLTLYKYRRTAAWLAARLLYHEEGAMAFARRGVAT